MITRMGIVKTYPIRCNSSNKIRTYVRHRRYRGGGGLQESPKAIAVKLDPTDYKANPDRYDNLEDYSKALEKEIVEAWDLERNMENLYYKYLNDSETKRLHTSRKR